MEIAIMLEGQMGLNWPRWKRIAKAVEDLGFVGLYRSDHFTNPNPPNEDSLEMWTSFAWLADNTERIEFGPLVSPVSFRDPVMNARQAKDVDDLSGGRFILGVGAGWQEREHHIFGYELLDKKARFDRFEEGLQVINLLLRNRKPVSFAGEYYELHDAELLPYPQRLTPILVGGNGPNRTLPLAARFADEWNGVFLTPDKYRELNSHLDDLVKSEGRKQEEVKRSLMTGLVFGQDEDELKSKTGERSIDDIRQGNKVVGIGSQVVDRLGEYEAAGVQRIMLQWLELDNINGLEALAKAVL
jgi:F420-dependent oxidoreductase-like protein